MPGLAIRLLGPPRIECDGTLVEVDTRKAIARLADLVVTGTSHTIWPLLSTSSVAYTIAGANRTWPRYT